MKGTTAIKSRIITIAMLVIFVFLLTSYVRVFFRDYELRREIDKLQTDVQKLEKRKIESLDVLKKLQSDSYIEERAREELQATKPGEAVLVVPGLTVSSTAAHSLTITEETPPVFSNPEKWWYYFFRPGTQP